MLFTALPVGTVLVVLFLPVQGVQEGASNSTVQLPSLRLLNVSTTENTVWFKVVVKGEQKTDGYNVTVSADDCQQCTRRINVPHANDTRTEFQVNGLRPGKWYNVTVWAVKGKDAGEPLAIPILTVPSAPVKITPVSRYADALQLQWTLPVDSEYDQFEVDIRNHTYRVEARSLTLSPHFTPGEQVDGSIRTIRAHKKSRDTQFTVVTKPLRPISLSVSPDYSRQSYEVSVKLDINKGFYDLCHLKWYNGAKNVFSDEQAAKPEGSDCRWHLPLQPGSRCNFTVWTSRNNEALSDPLRVEVEVKPAFDFQRFGVTVMPTETELHIFWNRSTVSTLWSKLLGPAMLTASLKPSEEYGAAAAAWMPPVQKRGTEAVIFDGLRSGECYAITVGSSVNGVQSDSSETVLQRTVPVVFQFSLFNVTATSAWFMSPMQDNVSLASSCEHHVRINGSLNAAKMIFAQRSVFFEVQQLQPYTTHSFSLEQVCGFATDQCPQERRLLLKNSVFRTAVSIPGPVTNVQPITLSPYAVNVHWKAVEQPNGELVAYLLKVHPFATEQAPIQELPWVLTLPPYLTNFTLTNLTGGARYAFEVLARNKAGLSPMVHEEEADSRLPSVVTFIWSPPKPLEVPVVILTSLREQEFLVRFNLSMLSTRHGLLEKYAVIVSEGADPAETNATLSWHDVQMFDQWPPYVAIVKPLPLVKFYATAPVTEAIGVDAQCVQLAKEEVISTFQSPFCNGPLRPGRKYRVKLRLYTVNNLFTDSDYSPAAFTVELNENPTGPMLTAILALMVLLVSVMIVLLVVKSRRRLDVGSAFSRWLTKVAWPRLEALQGIVRSGAGALRPKAAKPRGGGGAEALSLTQSPYCLQVDSATRRPVPKADFAKHFKVMTADSDLMFSEEFELLKAAGRSLPMTAADLPCNRLKNRFTNILPYDHNRVKLSRADDDDDGGSDYINASYVSGFNGPREYIVSQGPMPSTRDDFWRMVWEQQCYAIVNLTRCVEKGREKCDEYWPSDAKMVTYGDVEVVVLNESRFPLWTVREFLLQKNGCQRGVKNFHFTAWPDFGVPSQPKMLVDFVLLFRSQILDVSKPIVVHCSAGVGRSGTFVALDRLLQSVRTSDVIDVFGTVYDMRMQRVSMVQSEQQYVFIHQSILAALERAEERRSKAVELSRNGDIHHNSAFDDDEGIAESGM